GRPRPTAGRSARACRPARHTPCAVRSVALAAGPGPARRAGRPPRTRSGARSRRRHRTRPPSARRSRCGAGTPAPAAPDGQEATAATETRALLDACGPDRPRTRGPRGTDPAQHDRTASELLVVKVVANLDLPGALSITDAPRGPRSACDQQRSRWNQLSDQTLRLEYPNRLAQSRTEHAELRHQLRFGGEGVPFRKFAANDPATQIHGNEFGGFRHADGWDSLSLWFAPRIPPRDRNAATPVTSIHRW